MTLRIPGISGILRIFRTTRILRILRISVTCLFLLRTLSTSFTLVTAQPSCFGSASQLDGALHIPVATTDDTGSHMGVYAAHLDPI